MRRPSRIILTIVLAALAFLGGFTYRDFTPGHGARDAVYAVRSAFAALEAAATTISRGNQVKLSPIDTYWTAYNYVDANFYGDRTQIDTESDVAADEETKVPFSRQLTYSAVRGMIKVLGDRYTRFLDPETNGRFEEENRGDFEGIGAKLAAKDGRVYIKEPITNSPAIRAGLREGDVILKVDDHLIQGMDIDAVVKKIRGPRGKPVKITVQREGVTEPMEFDIIRDVIMNVTVEWKIVDEDRKIGYISLSQFNAKADEQIDKALSALQSKGAKALVLDLRDNPGGLLDMAVAVGSRFIKSGTIVTIRDRNGIAETRGVDPGRHNHPMIPLVVLINGGSASASEIVAGAIQDHKAGKIIGTDSFGKGLVQQISPLQDQSAVSITIARYLTPSGRDVAKHKIHPDIVVAEPTPEELAAARSKSGNKGPQTIAQQMQEDEERAQNDPQLKCAITQLTKALSASSQN